MGGGDYFKGWVPLSNHTVWVPPFRHDDAVDVIANDKDWYIRLRTSTLKPKDCT